MYLYIKIMYNNNNNNNNNVLIITTTIITCAYMITTTSYLEILLMNERYLYLVSDSEYF